MNESAPMPDGKRVGQTVHPIAHAWDQLVAKPFEGMMEGIRGAGHPRAPPPRAAGSSSATPLEGAIVFVLRYQSTTVSLLQTVAALGGTEAVTLEEATHCLVPSGLGLGVSPATRRVLRQAKEKSIPVVESTWLQIVAGLSAAEHWSEVSLDSHVPPIMAVVHGDFRASECRRSDGRRSQPVSIHELSASEISEIAASEISLSEISFSLDETWAYMRRGQPEEVEALQPNPHPHPNPNLTLTLTLTLTRASSARSRTRPTRTRRSRPRTSASRSPTTSEP